MRRELSREEIRELKRRRNRVKRARQLRRRVVLAIAVFIIILTSALGYTTTVSRAQESHPETKCYTSVMIPFGSTMAEVAADNFDPVHYESIDSYISEIMYINHLSDTDLYAGAYIVVPYYSNI